MQQTAKPQQARARLGSPRTTFGREPCVPTCPPARSRLTPSPRSPTALHTTLHCAIGTGFLCLPPSDPVRAFPASAHQPGVYRTCLLL